MFNLLISLSMKEIWNLIKSPKFIIIYMSVIVVLMLLIVVVAMINEKRFDDLIVRLKNSAEKSDGQGGKAGSESEVSRFEMLKLIDKQKKTYVEKQFNENFTLKEFCDEFRNFAADRLGLFYDIKTIRELISGMAVSKFIILQGMSGTGKTSLAFALGEFLGNPSTVIPVQPMWKERSDLLGYNNEFTKRFNETVLLQKMYEANSRKDIYVTILDELNIARVEYYFAEFLSLMEIPNPDSRYLELVYDKWDNDPEDLKNGCVKLPENMWFLGTANNDDSTFAISDKVYDRTMIIDLESKAEAFKARPSKSMPVTAEKFTLTVKEILQNNKVSADINSKLNRLDNYLQENFHISFGNRIVKQINGYLPVYKNCGGSESEAIDDILTKKVLRKLEMQNMAYRKNDAEELCKYIEELFGEGNMPRSIKYIRKIARSN